ncbi:hypothetical protein UFOVP1290_188 [uncultured Caudovirales phage]|uniref:Uncharacterized protein n=1 Tax=uncultured Caudovirales phage TaxID=2100421 RepID=A0A6J5RSP6_9CAUD|nr:hypothetical protein UFOVP1290_188 [uncultured Caudovirales phage]
MSTFPEYKEFVKTHADLIIQEMKDDFDPEHYDSKDCYSSIEAFAKETDDFVSWIESDYTMGMTVQGTCYENSEEITHEFAMYVIHNSDNIHHSIDGMYRKDEYKDIALACFEGDVAIRVADAFGIDYDPSDLSAFNRAR